MEKERLPKTKNLSNRDLIKTLQNKIHKIDQQINRLEMQQYQLKQNHKAARTRTLIQLGGLLVKSGIVKKLGLEIGADLQRDTEQKNKAYTLLGMLVNQLIVPEILHEIQELQELGKQFLFNDQNTEDNQIIQETSSNIITS